MKEDATVLSKWNAPPFLIKVTLCGTPILLLFAKASTSLSTILISGANVYPLPDLPTVNENICPFLTTILNDASTPSPFVITTFGFT